MRFVALSEFEREFKRLCKKYRSLSENLEEVRRAIILYPCGQGEKHWNRLHETETVVVLKTRVMCDSLKGSSLRLIYAYHPAESRIDFIEIYFKGDKENEDSARIKEYLKGLGK